MISFSSRVSTDDLNSIHTAELELEKRRDKSHIIVIDTYLETTRREMTNYNYDYRLRVSQSRLATTAAIPLSLQSLYWFERDHVQYAVRV